MFTRKRSQELPELQATFTELVHDKSGARCIHIANDDSENLFAIGFQTLPESDNGVAHILEHTVLCGSAKFPVKDPFFAMTRRSLATYMNALTGSDFTLYPASSELKKDFYNLLTVYIDALFAPLLRKESFLQEGWRLEPSGFKGVVYNEMKGAMAGLDARLWAKASKMLFPTSTYGFNSGGDPASIPELSYEELLAFYKTYYHPSRALFFFYGNFPLQEHLDFLEKHLLKDVEPLPALPPVALEKRYEQPVGASCPYPISEKEPIAERFAQVMGWLTCPITDQLSWLSLQMLDTLLMGSDGAPFKKALLESGLCSSIDSALDPDSAELPFLFIFKGLREEDCPRIEELTLKTLASITHFSPEEIEGALHQFELGRSEISGGSSPFGLSLCFRSVLLKLHGSDPCLGLQLHNLMALLRSQEPSYWTGLIQRFFLDNPHRISLTMIPDPHLEEQERAAEESRRRKMVAGPVMPPASEGSADLLPTITIADVSPTPKDYQLNRCDHYQTFTNGMVYATLACPLPHMSVEELQQCKLALSLLGDIGTKRYSFDELLLQEQLYSAGFSAQLVFEPKASNCQEATALVLFKMKGLERNSDKLFELFKEILFGTHFEEKERIAQLLKQQEVGLESSLTRNALRYAMNASTASFSHYLGLNYLLSGPTYLQFLRQGAKELRRFIPHAGSRLIITAEKEVKTDLLDYCEGSYTPYQPYPLILEPELRYPLASQVAFNAFSLPLFSYTHSDAALISLSAHLMEHLFLHPLIREQGGAYGARANSCSSSGYFSFSSYRDPHIAKTKESFMKAASEIAAGHFSEDDLQEAKLSILQDLDSPLAPGQRGETAFFWQQSGKSFALRSSWRERLLSATREEVARACTHHLSFDKAVFASFAGKGVV